MAKHTGRTKVEKHTAEPKLNETKRETNTLQNKNAKETWRQNLRQTQIDKQNAEQTFFRLIMADHYPRQISGLTPPLALRSRGGGETIWGGEIIDSCLVALGDVLLPCNDDLLQLPFVLRPSLPPDMMMPAHPCLVQMPRVLPPHRPGHLPSEWSGVPGTASRAIAGAAKHMRIAARRSATPNDLDLARGILLLTRWSFQRQLR